MRKQGYAYNEGHLLPGVSAAAFPLIDRTSSLVAVLAVMGCEERLGTQEGEKIIAGLLKATRGFGR